MTSISEQRLTEIARVGGWEWDAASGELTWSDILHEIAGVGAGFEPTWDRYFEVVHPDDRTRVERTFRKSLATADEYTAMHRFLTEAGGERLVLCRARIERNDDGTPARMIGATIDLTDLKPTAEVHRARHEQLGAAEELAGVGSFEWDIAADRVTWSDNLYRIFGRRPGELPCTYESYLGFVHPDDRNERRRLIDELLVSGEQSRAEHRIVRSTGEQRRVESVIRVIRDELGRPERLIGACRDITGD